MVIKKLDWGLIHSPFSLCRTFSSLESRGKDHDIFITTSSAVSKYSGFFCFQGGVCCKRTAGAPGNPGFMHIPPKCIKCS